MTKGERLKKRRDSLGFSQVDVADALGVSKQLYYKYENNIITNIPSNRIEDLARILGTTPSYIMGWDEDDVRTAEEAADIADVSLRLKDDKDMVQALKVYFTMPPDKKHHVVETIHMIGSPPPRRK